jgi:phenylalanyl-tRNA synthetase beta chain
MKFSYRWLREMVNGLTLEPRELERLITIRTAESEGVEEYGAAGACWARVLEVEPIRESHNVKALVETERYGTKTVVCGAPNCRVGVRTIYLPLGKKKIAGVESEGMLASAQEAGINRDHTGIVELIEQAFPPADQVIEIDNKSLTHRPDLWGHFGMAREVAAITGAALRDPVNMSLLPTGDPVVRVESDSPELCPRFSALVFENITVAPSPLWLQFRLSALGLNPINNIVDLTNYVMSELAQPMHAYDRRLLRGGTLTARLAGEGERSMALNHQEYALTPANLVIADAGGPVGIAGVIGGLDSAISEATASIVLEAANFNASSVRKTSSALKIRTDASMRFEKAQDPENTVRALARAIELMREVCPGARLVGGLADWKRELPAPPKIRLKLDWLGRKLGRPVPAEEVRAILERLGFGVSDDFEVTVPSWRAAKDVGVADDLVEEVGRMIGYDSIEAKPPSVLSTVPPDFPERTYYRRVRAMAAQQGFTEVYNYSFLSEEQAARMGFDPAALERVLNPIAANQGVMRPSLIPGIYANLVENRKHFETFRLFEIGREIHKRAAGLPEEVPHLALALYGEEGGLLELKRVAEALAAEVRVRPAEARAFEHPARTADVLARGVTVGRLFELHPSLIEGRAAILDFDLRLLEAHERRAGQYVPLRRYPSSGFDLTVLAGMRELAGELQDRMAGFAGALLEKIEYVGQYRKSDRKSVTFRFTVGAADRTLSSDEVGAVRLAVIEGMRAAGYELTV